MPRWRHCAQLRDLGVRIAMDDFGTGYSSLSYLRRFPFDRIKIDQSFVRDLDSRRDCGAIVRAVAGLSRELGMATTAEGVETQRAARCARRAPAAPRSRAICSAPRCPAVRSPACCRSIAEMLRPPLGQQPSLLAGSRLTPARASVLQAVTILSHICHQSLAILYGSATEETRNQWHDFEDTHAQIARLREQVETLMRDRVTPAVTNAAGRAEAAVYEAADVVRGPGRCGVRQGARAAAAGGRCSRCGIGYVLGRTIR